MPRYEVKVKINLPREITIQSREELSEEEIKEHAYNDLKNIKITKETFTVQEITKTSERH